MDLSAFSTSTAFNTKSLFEVMRVSYQAAIYKDVVHIVMKKEGIFCDAFFFPYGVAIFWGIAKDLGVKILREDIAVFAEAPIEELEIDELTFTYGDTAKIFEDEIILPNRDTVTMLAISHGIAQSVKLGTFETALKKSFHLTRSIPEDLARQGRISLSRREIRKKMGQLFIERNYINLHLEVLDTPDFFWEYPELEPLYMMTANYFDVRRRVEVLNQRLDVIHGLFEMLGTELNHSHSSRLEWTIILLIVIEVVLTVVRDFIPK